MREKTVAEKHRVRKRGLVFDLAVRIPMRPTDCGSVLRGLGFRGVLLTAGAMLSGFPASVWAESSVLTVVATKHARAAELQQSAAQQAEASAQRQTQAHELLDKMSHAQRELDYSGVFTYEFGSHLESLKIVHAVRDQVEHERLLHLDGEPREILRKGHEIDCIHGGARKVRLDHSIPAGMFAQRYSQHGNDFAEIYDLRIIGMDRVADRLVYKVAISPRDSYRYGHMLYIDKQSHLLLKSIIYDSKGDVLERFQFSSIDVGQAIADAELDPSTDNYVLTRHYPDEAVDSGADATHEVPASSEKASSTKQTPWTWEVVWVPDGFAMTGRDVRRQGISEPSNQRTASLETLMYTDGLSAFSVFLESGEDLPQGSGEAHQGATVAFSRDLMLNGQRFLLTVVGEVPYLTAEKVASSVQIAARTASGSE